MRDIPDSPCNIFHRDRVKILTVNVDSIALSGALDFAAELKSQYILNRQVSNFWAPSSNIGTPVVWMTWEPGNTGTPAILMTWEPGNTGKQTILITWDPGNTGKRSILITWDPGNTGKRSIPITWDPGNT